MPDGFDRVENLYVHFPFCRRKCSYCVLYSRTGTTRAERDAYVASLVRHLPRRTFKTVYFGGGTPALCDLTPLFTHLSAEEFTVELHPLDTDDALLKRLRDGGVNRISMGVQSLEDDILAHMRRGYTADEAHHAFDRVRQVFDNAGIDLIVGYPGERTNVDENFGGADGLGSWGIRHCSVYALQNERRLADVPDDETTMTRLSAIGERLRKMGLKRYEISNYAVAGFECRHNFAVWRGEDYIGLGDGASGRVGLLRTLNFGGRNPKDETVTPERDDIERTIFRLRTREGLNASNHPAWHRVLERFSREGLLTHRAPDTGNAMPDTYFLTPRGTEVCDTILAELV